MIRFGIRLAVSGGREALTRLVIIALAVAVGAGLLLVTLAGINAVNAQLTRAAALYPAQPATASAQPLWWSTREDFFDGQLITRVDVAATGPGSPTPAGVPRTPGPGEFYTSPALAKLLTSVPPEQLGDRYPGQNLGVISDHTLISPDSLLVIVGGAPGEVAKLPHVRQLATVGGQSPALPETVVNLILGVIAGGLLFPVLIFIGTATRLSAARREQRFAAMRLVGATPRQVSVIAATEAALAALAGVALGFALFYAFRGRLAGIPFTGDPFFPADMSLRPLDALVVALGVPAGAALASWVSLARVRISPLGVTRRVTPRPPRAWRLIPLLIGIAVLTFAIGHRPETSGGQTAIFLPGLLLIMAGLVLAGPWLTMAAARLMARRARHPATLIAARRLADNPKAGFRAISGIMLALFVTSVAVGVITTIVAERGPAQRGSVDASTLSTAFYEEPPTVPGTLLAELRAIPGVRTVTAVHSNPVRGGGAGVIACADIPAVYGRCADGTDVAVVAGNFIPWRESASASRVWPAAPLTAAAVAKLPVVSIVVGTDGSTAPRERVRTVLSLAFPDFWVAATAPGEFETTLTDQMSGWKQLADVIIIASLALAGCSLAVSVAGGLTERKRPFSLLRLTGVPVRVLRRVIALESAVPMLTVAVVAISMGFLAAQLFLRAQMEYTLIAPGAEYYVIVAVGLAACLGIIASTLPLLERVTGPETARSE